MRNLIDANFGWRVFPRRRPGTQPSAIGPETTGRAVAQDPASSQSPDRAKPAPCFLTYGKYQGEKSTLEDFKDAEWRGEAEFDNQYGR